MQTKQGTGWRGRRLACFCGVVLAVIGCFPLADAQARKGPLDTRHDQACRVTGAIPYWAQEQAIESFEKNIDMVDFISVFWYAVDPDGQIVTYQDARESRALIEHAHEHGVKVFALIANLPDDQRESAGGDWDHVRVGRIIGSAERRAAHIADLVDLSRRMGFDGIYIDYEALPGSYRESFTRFIQELGNALHAEGKLLAVAVHPKTAEDDSREANGSEAQDWDALHQHADQLHFMTYSQHTTSTGPGPAASARWLERVLRYAIEEKKVPRAKLYMGVPLYAEEWQELEAGEYREGDVVATFEDVQQRKRDEGGEETWSVEHGSPHIVFRDDDGRRQVIWFENRRSSEHKLALAAKLGVCNLLLWRLGGEDPDTWQLLRDRGYGPQPAPSAEGSIPEEAPEESDAMEEGVDADVSERRGYPRLVGEADAEVEYYSKLAATDPMSVRDNWVSNVNLFQVLEMTSRLAVRSDVRVVLESDGEDERFYTDFPYEGVYLRTLKLEYEAEHYAVFGGRYAPASGLLGRAPIFFGNYSTEMSLDKRIGLGASLTLASETLGAHTLTGHAFYLDTSRLSGELLTARGRNRRSEGGPGNTGRPDSFLVTLDGKNDLAGATLRYTLGGGVQQTGDMGSLDEHMLLGSLYGSIPLGQHGDIDLSADVFSLRNADGEAEYLNGILLGVGYSDWPLYFGTAYSIRIIDPVEGEGRRTDFIAEVVARWGFDRFIVEAAYQNVREGGEEDHTLGAVFRYMIDWAVK